MFYGTEEKPLTRIEKMKAKGICQQCLVRDHCLQQALDNGERHGIWGGLDERERQKLRKTL